MSAKPAHPWPLRRGALQSIYTATHPFLAILIALALVLGPVTSLRSFAEGDDPPPVATTEATPDAQPAETQTGDATAIPTQESTAVAPELTTVPTEEATADPTGSPSPAPTDSPTAEPTNSPSPTPTDSPTAEPTNSPSPAPTDSPTAEPTNSPTSTPTDSPTAEPTESSTPDPAASPSDTPTAVPSSTLSPSPSPTEAAPLGSIADSTTPTGTAVTETPTGTVGTTTYAASTPTMTPNTATGSTNSPTASSTAPVSASSGDAGAIGNDAQTNLANSQQSGVVAGGGPVSVAATNSNSNDVTDMGSASAQTGASGAQNGSSLSGTPGTGQATAISGDAAASGVNAENNVLNTSQANIAVGGGNYAPVSSLSSNEVSVLDAGAADAASGTAIAKIAPTSEGGGQALPMATPIGTLTPNHSATPVLNNVQGTNLATVPPNGTPGPVTINQNQTVSLTNVTGSSATSAPTCTGPTCATPEPIALSKIAPGGSTAATSGGATAQGLNAQNNVSTNASVNINITGQNFGVINVVIETITNIVNKGIAAATSGSAVASVAQPTGPVASPAVPSPALALAATSADAKAAVPQVTNNVGLNTSADVRLTGNNYNPITVVLEIVVNIFNHGSSTARSGNAQVSPPATTGPDESTDLSAYSGLFASSGAASAVGLSAMNNVSLGANANILINGSNFAPITTRIRLVTNIINQGIAEAISGDAQATRPTETSVGNTGTPSNSPSPSTSAATAPAVPTGLGDAASASTSALAQAHVGSASANDTTFVAAGAGDSSVEALSQQNNDGSARSSSGAGSAAGSISEVLILNQQTAQVSAPGAKNPEANNLASFTIQSVGVASVQSGESLVGLTPTPVPSPSTDPAADGAQGSNGLALDLNGWVSGSLIVVDPWAGLPGYDLAPMPGQSVKIVHPRTNPIVWSAAKPTVVSKPTTIQVAPVAAPVPAVIPSMPLIHSEPQQQAPAGAAQFGPNGLGGPPAASPIELLRALALAALVGGVRLRRGIFDALLDARHRLIPSRGLGGT